jgi:hypothetical protein
MDRAVDPLYCCCIGGPGKERDGVGVVVVMGRRRKEGEERNIVYGVWLLRLRVWLNNYNCLI